MATSGSKRLPDDKPLRLTSDGVNDRPLWSPSGQWLAYRKHDAQLWLYSLAAAAAQPLDQGAPVNDYEWSPTADRLAYLVGSGITHVRVWTATESESQVLLPPSLEGYPMGFVWSPSGDWLAYQWYVTEPNGAFIEELRMIPVTGGDPVLLFRAEPFSEGYLNIAAWLPQGRHLLIYRGPRPIDSFLPETVSLLTLPIDQGQPYEGEPAIYTENAAWMLLDDLANVSDGIVAVVVGEGPTWTTKRIALAGVPITPADQVAIQPAAAPDGLFLAYSAMPDGNPSPDEISQTLGQRRIWVVETTAGFVARALTSDPTYRDEHPQWSADGRDILFARLDAGWSRFAVARPQRWGQTPTGRTQPASL